MNGNVTQRLFWAAILAAIFGVMYWQQDFFLSLQGGFEYATYTTLAVAIVVCAVGVILPPRWAEPVQYIIVFLALLSQIILIAEKYL